MGFLLLWVMDLSLVYVLSLCGLYLYVLFFMLYGLWIMDSGGSICISICLITLSTLHRDAPDKAEVVQELVDLWMPSLITHLSSPMPGVSVSTYTQAHIHI